MSAFSEFWLIFKVHLRVRLGLSAVRTSMRTGKGKLKLAGFTLLGIYVLAALWFMVFVMFDPLMKAAVSLENETGGLFSVSGLLLGMVVLLIMLMALVLGTLSLLGIVFNSKDTEIYAALPIRQASVFSAKFGMVYLTELSFTLFIILPCAFIYAIHAKPDFLFWLRLPFVALLLPVIPLTLSSVLAYPLTIFSVKSRHKDIVLVVLTIILIIGYVAGQMYLSSVITSSLGNIERAMEILADENGILYVVLGSFPPALWAAKALAGTSFVSWLLLFALCSVSFGLTLFISGRLYYKSVLTQLETKKTGGKKKALVVRAGSPVTAFFLKELKIIFRTPIYAMNQLVCPVMMPVVIIMSRVTSEGNFSFIETFFRDRSEPVITTLIISAVFAFISIINPSAATTFSRDGVSLFFIKSLPVPVSVQLAGRFLCSLLFPAAGVIFTIITLAVLFPLSAEILVSSLLISLTMIPLCTITLMLPDCIKPKLHWNSESEAMKQNMNAVFGMLSSLLSLAPAAAASVLLIHLDAPLPVVSAVITIINGGMFYAFRGFSYKKAGIMIDNL